MRKEPIAPALREHSEEILVEFEFSAAEIKERVDKGVVMNASLDNR